MRKFFKGFNIAECIIWSLSTATVIISFLIFKNRQYHFLFGAMIGITALLFVSKGNPTGQFLTVVFSVFYGVISFSFKYYGEMITYLGMSAPMAVIAFIAWIKNPYKGGENQVKINCLSIKEWCLFLTAATAVSAAFYFILQALETSNLIISTVSVFTSFAAAYLTMRRSRFYAVAYGMNDAVLIIMWSLASAENLTYLPMVICFAAFFTLDTYGFINWSRMNRKQNKSDAAK